MNSTIKVAADVAEELNQSNENSGTKREDMQHIKAKLGEPLKEKCESLEYMVIILEMRINSLLAKKTRAYGTRGEI